MASFTAHFSWTCATVASCLAGSIQLPVLRSMMFSAAQCSACFLVMKPVLVRRFLVGSVYWTRHLTPFGVWYFVTLAIHVSLEILTNLTNIFPILGILLVSTRPAHDDRTPHF